MTVAEREVPRRIGPYRVIGLLGRGGMASVYRVLDPRDGQSYALKLLTHREILLTRFYKEYRALARLNHPGIVRVFDFGLASDRQPFLTMELVEGLPVQVHMKGVGRPGSHRRNKESLRVLAGIAEILDFLHERRFLHRDIKSSNIMVRPDGSVKLLDMGSFAPMGGEEGSPVETDFDEAFLGTLAYASPEQILNQRMDARSDLYSLGVLFYRMLTGRTPFQSDDPSALAHLHLTWTPPAPAEVHKEIPARVSSLAMRLLARDPEARPESARALLLDLDGLLGPTESRPVPPTMNIEPILSPYEFEADVAFGYLKSAPAGALLLLRGAPNRGHERFLADLSARLRDEGFDTPQDPLTAPRDPRLPWAWLPVSAAVERLCGGRSSEEARVFRVLPSFSSTDLAACAWIAALCVRVVEISAPIRFGVFTPEASPRDEIRLRGFFQDALRLTLPPIGLEERVRLQAAILGQPLLPPRAAGRLASDHEAPTTSLAGGLQELQAKGEILGLRAPSGATLWVDAPREVEAGPEAPEKLPASTEAPLLAMALDMVRSGSLTRAESLLRDVATPLPDADPDGFLQACFALVDVLIQQARFSEAGELLADLTRYLRFREHPTAQVHLRLSLCALEIEMFRLGLAQGRLEEARLLMGMLSREERGRGCWPDLADFTTLLDLRIALVGQTTHGVVERAEGYLEEVVGRGLVEMRASILAALGLVKVLAGNDGEGHARIREALSMLEGRESRPASAFVISCLAEGLRAEDDPRPLLEPVLAWSQEEPALLARMRAVLAIWRHDQSRGTPSTRHDTLHNGRALLARITQALTPEDRLAMRIHPWVKALGDSSQDAPSVPGPSRGRGRRDVLR